METINTLFTNIHFLTIVKIYGMLCLLFLPISFIVLVKIYVKNPAIIKKFDKKIDDLAGRLANEKPTEPKPESKKVIKDTDQIIEEKNNLYGIPNMMLTVGDKYRCQLSVKNRKDINGTNQTWSTDNQFSGKIHEHTGMFEAVRVGTVYISCGREDNHIYYANIQPTNADWFAAKAVIDILKRQNVSNIETREIRKKILKLDKEKCILSYSLDNGKLTYQYDNTNCVKRFLYKIKRNKETIENIMNNMKEYFAEVSFKEVPKPIAESIPNDTKYWFHKSGMRDIFSYPDTIDFVAFIKESHDGELYFGCGECWRAGAEEIELTRNLEMVERSFISLLDNKDIPKIIGSKLSDKEEETAENEEKNNTGEAPKKTQRIIEPEPVKYEDEPSETPEERGYEGDDNIPVNENDFGEGEDEDLTGNDENYDEGYIEETFDLDEENDEQE